MKDNDRVRFYHFQICDGRGTAAYKVVKDMGDKVVVDFAFSFCAPRDQFSRKLGRVKSSGRLNSDRYRRQAMFDILPHESFYERLTEVLSHHAAIEMPNSFVE